MKQVPDDLATDRLHVALIHRPFEVWPILGDCRLEFFYVGLTAAVWLVTPNKRFEVNSLSVALFCFFVGVLFAALVSPWGDACTVTLDNYYKYYVFYAMLVTVVHTEEDLKRLVLAYLGVLFIYMLHSLLEFHNGRYVYRMGICRMQGVDTSSDPNAFAASIVLTQVFVSVLWRAYPTRAVRGFLFAFVALSVLCVNLTGSRGGFVMLVLWASLAIWNSAWRWRLLGPTLLAAPLLFMALPAPLQNRFETIINPDVGPKNAELSADVRRKGPAYRFGAVDGVSAQRRWPRAWQAATHRDLKAPQHVRSAPG